MRLRSNHVLEPVAEWEQTRRRHVRASSAQSESESESQPEPQPARRRRGARSVSTQPETQQESQPATRRRNTRGSSAQPEAQPEPQQPPATRRRRNTRGSSAQPESQSEPNEQVLSTPARQARRGRAANKDKPDLVTNLLELVSSSPALSPLVSHSGSPIAVSLAVVSTPVAFLSPIPEVSSAPATPATPSPAGGIFDTPMVSVMEEEDVFFTPLAPTPQNVVLSSFVSTPEDVFYTPVGPTPTSTFFVPSGPLGPPGPRVQKPQNRMYTDLWLPRIEPSETTLAVMTSEDPEMRRRSTRPTRRRHRLPPLYYGSAATLLARKPNSNPLTRTQDGNRKRTRTTEDETPAKRYKPAPVMTPGGSLIRARGSSRTTYADRTRRRQAEIGGRIHSTMFRVPEYLAQRDADARSASLPQDNDTHEQTPTPEESALPRETPVPATPIRANTPGWGRWVFDSVSRRWTGILGRPNVPQAADASHPAEREQQHTQAETSQQHSHSSLTAVSSSVAAGTSATSPVRGSPAPVASARTDSHQAPAVPPRRRYNNYDLFSAGYSEEQRARWLINVPPAPTAPVTTAIDSSTTQSAPQSSRAAQPETPTASKRKRQPTPDKIPNPPGCSYGLHDDYFIYDDEDWEANEKYNEQHPKITPTRAGASEDPDTEKRSSKRVRIKSPANSNQATSSRKMGSRRSRAERPANFNWSGHFEVPYSSSESSSSTRTSPASQSQTPGPFPSSPAATPRVNASRRERVERPGPSEAPYSSPENSGSIASSPLDLPAPNTRSYHTTVESVEGDHSSFRDESPKTIGGNESPKAEKDLGPLQKARDQAEQYKPKTPSRLRAAHRFSSSNTSYATSRSPFVRELEYVSTEAVRRRMMRETSLAKACPSGDMNQIRWPENDTWENRLRGGLTREVVAYNRRTQRHNLLSPAKLEEFDQRYHEALSRRRLESNYKPSLWSQRQLVK
ncbi:hypothetical protein N7452_010354 [Penicillium brevicompactum]|uniref:Uncharacterized protein n=1 Tax=Penicillium brevicompactum TaxID=5074 RepID=A0A9W9QBJ4_PENBR|nr:hypothetical protein N7452_010354 [Penicillium brevicompactum]